MADTESIHPEFADLWPAGRGRVNASLADVERGVRGLQDGSSDDRSLEAARLAAHTLVGTLGTYGLLTTSATMREIEAALEDPEGADPLELRARLDEVARAVSSA